MSGGEDWKRRGLSAGMMIDPQGFVRYIPFGVDSQSPVTAEREKAVAFARSVLANAQHEDGVIILARQLLRALGLPERV